MLTKKPLILASLMALTPLVSMADGPYGVPIVSEVRSVYDGDTFRVDVEGWPRIIGNNMPIRLLGADTPEMRSRCDTVEKKERERALAAEARDFTATALESASIITLHQIDRGTFFRIVADVRLDGESLSDRLFRAGLAVPFVSGSDSGWCNDELPVHRSPRVAAQ